jgi:Rrf2 family protein
MFSIPWSSVYAIHALRILAARKEGMPLREIAQRGGLPLARLSKIMQTLRRGGLVRGTRGRGYALAIPAEQIDLLSVLRVMEGGLGPEAICLLKNPDCAFRKECPVWRVCCELYGRALDLFSSVTIGSLPAKVKARCASPMALPR